jgi:penicillin-insensitive murein endopeptidase
MLLSVGHQWSQLDSRKFGVGNISLADGTEFKPHRSHRNGLQVDVRALRKDGRETPCSIFDAQYDRTATVLLINLFQRHPFVHRILFNDTTITGVRPTRGHNDHFHVDLRKFGQ